MRYQEACRGVVAVLAAGAVIAVGPGAAAAPAAPTVSMTTPEEGAVISRGASPMLEVAGTVAFETPVPQERIYYVRRSGCQDDQRLSVVRGGAEETACSTPVTEPEPPPPSLVGGHQSFTIYEAVDGVPLTLDASRPLTGVVTQTHGLDVNGQRTGAGPTDIGITVFAGDVVGIRHNLGRTSVAWLALPTEPHTQLSWSIDPPTGLDKKDFVSLEMHVNAFDQNPWRTYTVPNETNLTVPIYSASFDRRVQVSLDGGPFSAAPVTLAADLTGWTASVPTPEVGGHTVAARALQGNQTSATVPRTFTVID